MDIIEKLNRLLTDTTAHAEGSVDMSRGPYGSNIMGMRYIKKKKKVKGGAEYKVHESHLKPGQKVKFVDKDDDFYGKMGTVYKVFKNGYTVKIGNKVVSRDDDEVMLAEGKYKIL